MRVDEAGPAHPRPAVPEVRAPYGSDGGVVGRIGLFVGGWFALGVVHWAYFTVAGWLVGVGSSPEQLERLPRIQLLPAALAAAVFAGGLVWLTSLSRRGPYEPLGVVTAWAASQYIALTAGVGFYAVGIDGSALFWLVTTVALAATVSLLLWVPHPILGLNTGIVATIAILAAPVPTGGSGTAEVVAGKALLVGLALVTLALVVEVRTATRAGSALHYGAVLAVAIATVAGYLEVGPAIGIGLAFELGFLDLLVALVAKRRSWALLGWITLELAVFAVLRLVFDVELNRTTLGVAALPILAGALVVQRNQDTWRNRILDGLPPRIRAGLPV